MLLSLCPMSMISIETKLLAYYFHETPSICCQAKRCFFAVTRCVGLIVVHEMFAEVYNNTGTGNKRAGFAKFLVAPVAVQELKVSQSHQHLDFFNDDAMVAFH
jgi:hypothetical protein